MTIPPRTPRPWQHVLKLAVWLYVLPPVGLVKLWMDRSLSASAKWRIILYLYAIPFLLYLTVSLKMANNALQRWLP